MKNIWIINHYATRMLFEKKGRHFDIAKSLVSRGYNVSIICASTVHNSDNNINGKNLEIINEDGITWIVIPTDNYQGNGFSRIKNMYQFFSRIKKFHKKFPQQKPDIIYSSSVHLLTLHAGHILARKYKSRHLMEVRDLWPESLIAYEIISKESLISKFLYKYEHYLYKKADKLIFTWSGAKRYLIERNLHKSIDLQKVNHISNGVNQKSFEQRVKDYNFSDVILDDPANKCFVYTGSIRKVNDVLSLVKAVEMKILSNGFQLCIFGDGDELENIKTYIKEKSIVNVHTYGHVDAKYIPSILTKSYVNILHNKSSVLDKYGQSQNKLYEYISSNRCILQTYKTYKADEIFDETGLYIESQNVENISRMFNYLTENSQVVESHSNHNKGINYDYDNLTTKLLKLI